MEQNNHYNKRLKNFAQGHRNASTKAEIRIWCELLRNRKMLGFQFLRQRPIGNYIADFMCKELMLVIEVDGYSHNFKYKQDKVRDQKIKEMGFHTMRFTDDEVKNHIANVERAIVIWIEERGCDSSSPPRESFGPTLFKGGLDGDHLIITISNNICSNLRSGSD